MSSLDDKLRDILRSVAVGYLDTAEPSEEDIAQIKQAFADEVMPMVNQMANLANDAMIQYGNTPRVQLLPPEVVDSFTLDDVMTGEEWFEKFVHALLEDGTYLDGDTEDLNKVMDAARLAAGLEETTDDK